MNDRYRNEPLAAWERELLYGQTVATATFHLENGKTVEFEDVCVDSIGPRAENPGVVGVEFENDSMRVVHIPFVLWWEIEYR